MLLTIVVHLPHLNDHTQNGLAARGGHTTSIYMDYPFPSDRIDSPSGTVDVTGRERRVYGHDV